MQLVNRSYSFGNGFISPDNKKFLITIPKNASSYLGHVFSNHGWQIAMIQDCGELDSVIVPLRDPVERWISGIAQYLQTYIFYPHGPNTPHLSHETPRSEFDYGLTIEKFLDQYNQLSERILFDNLTWFDDHVWPQVAFFEHLAVDVGREYLYINNSFNQQLYEKFGFETNYKFDRNSHVDQPVLTKLQEFFQQRFLIRPELQQRVKNAYHRDYELIEKVLNETR